MTPFRSLQLVTTLLLTTDFVPPGRAENTPRFEVASIRVNASGHQAIGGFYGIRKGGSVSVRNVTLRDLIYLAFRVDEYRLAGGPHWMASTRYDVVAKPLSPTDDAEARLMLQSLLSDRFELRMRQTVAEVRGYALRQVRGGVKLQPTTNTGEGGIRTLTTTSMHGSGISIQMLVHALSTVLRAPVRDETDLTGRYDITVAWVSEERLLDAKTDGHGLPEGQSIFTALKESCGLELRASRVSVNAYVVEHAAPPSAN